MLKMSLRLTMGFCWAGIDVRGRCVKGCNVCAPSKQKSIQKSGAGINQASAIHKCICHFPEGIRFSYDFQKLAFPGQAENNANIAGELIAAHREFGHHSALKECLPTPVAAISCDIHGT